MSCSFFDYSLTVCCSFANVCFFVHVVGFFFVSTVSSKEDPNLSVRIHFHEPRWSTCGSSRSGAMVAH